MNLVKIHIHILSYIVLATVVDGHFASGSGSEPNWSQIGGLGRKLIRTVNWGTIELASPYPSQLGGFSPGCPAGPSVNTYNMFAIAI